MTAGTRATAITREQAQRTVRALQEHIMREAPYLMPQWQQLVAYTDKLEAELADMRAGVTAAVKMVGAG